MRVISVIMGVYNAENSVERAVRSLYTYTGDMEVIAVNDGSKDGTADKLFRLSEEFPSLKVFSLEENCGLTYCLNFALEKSAGEFVARMDADDICRVGRFEKQLAFLNGHPDYAFTGGGARLFDEKGVYARRSFPAQPQLSDIIRGNPFIHPTLLVRREALLKVGGYRDVSETVRCEDYDLVFRLYAARLYGYNLQDDLISYYEPRNLAKKHTFRTRRNEFYVRMYGSRLNRSVKGRIYAFKPLILAFLPAGLYRRLHKNREEKL